MATEIRPYTEDMIDAVKAFNERLKRGGTSYRFPERHRVPLPPVDGVKVFQEYFVALEDQTHVRGAYILQHQTFSCDGKSIEVAHYDLPISEGFVDKRYGLIGIQLVMNALKRQPCLFSLGLGGHDEPLAQMLKKLGWRITEVPFFFKVVHPATFLRNIQPLRKNATRRLMLDLFAMSGAGWIGLKAGHYFLEKRSPLPSAITTERVDRFGAWADELWGRCHPQYSLCANRESGSLNALYRNENRPFVRLKVSRDQRPIGWAVLLDTRMSNSQHFGNMRVGSIVDCLASREDAPLIVRKATEYLESTGVDMVLSNQSDAAWASALRQCGFLCGPSNYLFAASKKLQEHLRPVQDSHCRLHLTRGDGGGPMGL